MKLRFSLYFYTYSFFILASLTFILFKFNIKNSLDHKNLGNSNFITGERVKIKSSWIGRKPVSKTIPILLLAGHADSQGIAGRGTLGEAVSLKGKSPMNPAISDELYWNLELLEAVVSLGKKRGLQISSYVPPVRNILDPNNPITNWSVGAKHASKGGYSLEIHFDAYGKFGMGSGLIPPLSKDVNTIDESLAQSFGRFPLLFRGGLGAPRRQIRVLEIGKLEGVLEKKLRDLDTRETTLQLIADRIVRAILLGINQPELFSRLLYREDIFLAAIYL